MTSQELEQLHAILERFSKSNVGYTKEEVAHHHKLSDTDAELSLRYLRHRNYIDITRLDSKNNAIYLINRNGMDAVNLSKLIFESEDLKHTELLNSASIRAANATTSLAADQIKFNTAIKNLTIIATVFVGLQLVFMSLQYCETKTQTKISKQQLELSKSPLRLQSPIYISIDSASLASLYKNDTLPVKIVNNNLTIKQGQRPKH